LLEQDDKSQFPEKKWAKCARFGILGLCFPEEYGGQGRDIPTTILALEGLGYGCEDNGLLSALNGQMWAAPPAIRSTCPNRRRNPIPKRDLPGHWVVVELWA